MFRLTKKEAENLGLQFTTLKNGRGGRRSLSCAFTEQGVAMLSSVLNSERAIDGSSLLSNRRYDQHKLS